MILSVRPAKAQEAEVEVVLKVCGSFRLAKNRCNFNTAQPLRVIHIQELGAGTEKRSVDEWASVI